MTIRLVIPCHAFLPGFEAALAAGWSPNTERDISAEQLAELRRDRDAYLAKLAQQGRSPPLPDGRPARRLPSYDFWIVDGEFCGRIGLRFQPGTEALPAAALGHIGYGVVPWKRRRGYATQALRLVLPVARAEGLVRVLITCDDDNEASKKVILANGGVFSGRRPHPSRPGHVKLAYWVPTACEP
jgi:predicted acetyltransferase